MCVIFISISTMSIPRKLPTSTQNPKRKSQFPGWYTIWNLASLYHWSPAHCEKTSPRPDYQIRTISANTERSSWWLKQSWTMDDQRFIAAAAIHNILASNHMPHTIRISMKQRWDTCFRSNAKWPKAWSRIHDRRQIETPRNFHCAFAPPIASAARKASLIRSNAWARTGAQSCFWQLQRMKQKTNLIVDTDVLVSQTGWVNDGQCCVFTF